MKTIFELHYLGGPIFMFALTFILITLIILAVIVMVKFTGQSDTGKRTLKNLIMAILYLGSFAAVWGILGQGLGIYQALYAIQMAGDISPALIVGGIRVSMIAPLYGIFILLFSSILWLGLKIRYNQMISAKNMSHQ